MAEWKNHRQEMQPGVMVNFQLRFISFNCSFFAIGFNIPANYDDVGLNCGGLGVQNSNSKKINLLNKTRKSQRNTFRW